MSQHRAPSPPPQIPGFDYVQLLGSGGFADVFLFQQNMPRRRVAVKVLLKDAVSDGGAESFTTEANLMAQLSTHPAIVSIYEAGISTDGRPYLVMEYCSKPNLQARYRRQRLSVAEALRIGIQVAGAVETAHRAGILHRDIKPANILVTEYGRPALTDFGIAGTTTDATESAGMSIPWSPPESFAAGAPSSPATDVYALAATVYTMLAGRSPFEKPGGKNGATDLIDRIQRDPLATIERADVPDSLYRVLATAMAKNPGQRYRTALEFAWALQKVQVELAMSVTAVDVIDETADDAETEDDDDGRTRVRSIVSIDPGGDGTAPLDDLPFSTTDATVLREIDSSTGVPTFSDATVARRAPVAENDHTVARRADPRFVAADRSVEHTQARPLAVEEGASGEAPAARSRKGLVAAGIVVLVVGLGGTAYALTAGKSSARTPSETAATIRPVDGVVVPSQVVAVSKVLGAVDGEKATFAWSNPDPAEGDLYLWGVQVAGEARELQSTADPTVVLPYTGDRLCIEVYLRRADGRTAREPGVGCVP